MKFIRISHYQLLSTGSRFIPVLKLKNELKNRFKLSKPRWSKFINEKNATLINHYERNDSSLETIENFHCIGDYTYKILPNTVEAAVASSYNLFNKLRKLPSVK